MLNKEEEEHDWDDYLLDEHMKVINELEEIEMREMLELEPPPTEEQLKELRRKQ